MISALKKQWREFKEGRPGHRFQERYERKTQGRADESALRRWFQPIAGVIVIAAGVFFCFFPGPGLPLLLAGAVLLAERSRPMARMLDWTELKARNAIRRGKEWWQHASLVARSSVIVVTAFLVACAGYGAYRVLGS